MTTRHSSYRNGRDPDTISGGGHTQFLDLTNGEGGDRNAYAASGGAAAADDDDEADGDSMLVDSSNPAVDTGGTNSSPEEMMYESTPASTRARSANVDPNTPGKVVESGQEHTGRWTKEEHEAFLSALQMYGKEWKKVAAKVKTRTVVQTRTHAQKYFQKLQKTMEQTGNDDLAQVDMGVSSETKPRASSSGRKKHRATPQQPAAPPNIAPTPAPGKVNRRSSNTTINAAQVISNLSSASKSCVGHYVAAGSSVTMSSAPPPRHGFSTTADTGSSSFSTWMSSNAGTPGAMAASIKISAPDPTSSLRKGFPEPSPAATGKRKLAEIAAARMLAGVAGKPPPAAAPPGGDGPPTPPPPQPATPPPGLNLKDAPVMPPLFSGSVAAADVNKGGRASGTSSPGFTLQIVNPDTLGVSFEQKRKRDGEGSPVTPWEGQLKALVDEEEAARKIDLAEPSSPVDQSTIGLKLGAIKAAAFHISTHSVCGPGDSYGRSKLHQSVCDRDLETLDSLLSDAANRSEDMLQKQDEAGYRPLHTACSLCLGSNEPGYIASVSEVIRRLLKAGADVSKEDNNGNTALHWAARAGDKDAVSQILFKNPSLDAQNHNGETPLHCAMRAGYRSMEVVSVLLDSGARPSITDNSFRRPIDVAAEGFLDDETSLASIKSREPVGKKTMSKDLKRALRETAVERREVRANLLIRSPQSRSLVLHHPECLEHHPKSSSDWEAPDRIVHIMRRILPSSDASGETETSGIFPHEVTVTKEFDRAKLDLLSRVHSTEYLSFVNSLSKDLEKQLKDSGSTKDDESESGSDSRPPVVPFTPLVQRTMIKVEESSVKLNANSDTSFSAGSLKAARRAAGAVQHAVDCVLVGRNRNAFCVVRPPGHHAGINGLLEGGESCGFCIFNNVAAGALYAIADDRLLCERCAIVDIDVHHGNGTEEIVRKCQDPRKLFFFSIHLYDNDKRKGRNTQYKFYPGTGSEDDLALNIINVPMVPLWKETPPAPVPVKTHNTRNKARAAQQENVDDSSETGTGRGSDMASDAGGSTPSGMASPRNPTGHSGRAAYRQAIRTRLLPALRAFNPDLILISAGFDAAKGDVGNARHERAGEKIGLDLEPEDYAWTTRKILEIADMCCHGRVVSVLEGGYGRTPRDKKPSQEAETKLDRTVFAECATRHLHAMIDPYDSEKRFK